MSTYTICHAREIRTFVTVEAESEDQAIERARAIIDADPCDLDVEDDDPGDFEIREVQP